MSGGVPHPTLLGPGPICTWGPLVLYLEPQSTRSAPPPGFCTSCAPRQDAVAESQRPEDPVTIPDRTVGARRLGLGTSGLRPGNGCQPCCMSAPVWYWWAGPTLRGVRKGPPSPGPADSPPPLLPCILLPLFPNLCSVLRLPVQGPSFHLGGQHRGGFLVWVWSRLSALWASPGSKRGSPGKRRSVSETSSEVHERPPGSQGEYVGASEVPSPTPRGTAKPTWVKRVRWMGRRKANPHSPFADSWRAPTPSPTPC